MPDTHGSIMVLNANGTGEEYGSSREDWTPAYGKGVNLLDNWYFVGGGSQQGGGQFPINQREGYIVPPDTPYYPDTNLSGQSGTVSVYTAVSYVNTTYGTIDINGTTYYVKYSAMIPGYINGAEVSYTIDRWRMGWYDQLLFTQSGITFGDTQLWQPLEPALIENLMGKQVTLSYLKENRLVTRTGIFEQLSSDYEHTGAHIVLNNEGFGSSVMFDSDCGGFSAVKLELGTEQTLAHQDANGNWVLNDAPPNFQQELAKCQRYYLPRENNGWTVGEIIRGGGVMLVIPTPVTLRTWPTIIDTTNSIFLSDGWNSVNFSSLQFHHNLVNVFYTTDALIDTYVGNSILFENTPALSADL